MQNTAFPVITCSSFYEVGVFQRNTMGIFLQPEGEDYETSWCKKEQQSENGTNRLNPGPDGRP